jgi:hypothetical protein
MRRLISGELANYSVVRTSPDPLQKGTRSNVSKHAKAKQKSSAFQN